MSKNSPTAWKLLTSNGQFGWLLAGNTAMFFGFFSTLLLRSLLAWELTGDEMALAYINLVAALCMFASSLVAGVIIDRFERRRLIMVAQLIVVAAETTVLGLLLLDQLSFTALIASAVAASIAFPFIMPSRTAMLVDAVGYGALSRANALIGGGVNVARMASPAALGFIIDANGFVLGYLLLLSLHILSLGCTVALRDYPAKGGSEHRFWQEFSDGFRYIASRGSLTMAIVFGLLPMLVVVPLQNLMVIFVDEIWGQSGTGLGIMMAAMGIGGLLGSLLTALFKEANFVLPLGVSTLALALMLSAFAYTPSFMMAALLVVGIYGCSAVSQTLVGTACQVMTEDRVRGRVTTITMMSMSLSPLATLPLAFASKNLGASSALTLTAALLALAALLIWWLSTAFRQIDSAAK